ncbi:hypothetical protein L210DRAFT_3767066 [Boletus edulis BED1]|uniref:Uncharacterized protein n=1 Tax=Boletus edulis BED1 TaxID=1328754 RepID=A0AAD4BBM7_BOLED|nr:hypothetical protein L210DRAFT_3767066 [Boletus edulis BED1]
MTPARPRRTEDGMLSALPPHLTRPLKDRRRTSHPKSGSSSPLSLPPMSFDPEKGNDVEEITSPNAPSARLDQKVSVLEDKIDAMQTRTNAVEKEAEVLKERLASLNDRLVALEKVA